MSVSAKAAPFPVPCANSACGQALGGPVKHCPFCGVAVQPAVAAKAAVASTYAAPAAPAPTPLHFDLDAVESQPAPAAVAPKPAPAPAPEIAATPAFEAQAKPRGRLKKVALGLVALLLLGAFGLYQLGSRQGQEKLEQILQAGKDCLRKGDFTCAIDNADQILGNDRNEPRALSLKQQAQTGMARQQKVDDDKQARIRLDAEAARQAAAEKARLAQAQAAREQEARETRQQEEAQQAAAPVVRQPVAPAVLSRPATPMRPAQNSPSASMLGQTLNQARQAMARRDFQSAIAVAQVVLNMDPGNVQARSIMRQAQQQQAQALNRTTIE